MEMNLIRIWYLYVMWGHSYHRRRRNRDVRRAAERAERDAQASTRDAQGTSSG